MIKPYFEDNLIKVYNKTCTDMSEPPDNSIQACITSPPYYGLRRYQGNQDLIWGGSNHHEHEWTTETKTMEYVQGNPEFARPHREKKSFNAVTNTCSICNAWKGANGLEPTPELYVQHTVEILREIRRVLRPDGACFWNVGDSYYASGGAGGDYNKGGLKEGQPKYQQGRGKSELNLKPKDLCLIPFRVAIVA